MAIHTRKLSPHIRTRHLSRHALFAKQLHTPTPRHPAQSHPASPFSAANPIDARPRHSKSHQDLTSQSSAPQKSCLQSLEHNRIFPDIGSTFSHRQPSEKRQTHLRTRALEVNFASSNKSRSHLRTVLLSGFFVRNFARDLGKQVWPQCASFHRRYGSEAGRIDEKNPPKSLDLEEFSSVTPDAQHAWAGSSSTRSDSLFIRRVS